MVTSKVLASLTIFFALNIVTSTNANLYTYITNALYTATYTAAGFKPANFVQKWIAEGNAIFRALNILYSLDPTCKLKRIVFGSKGSVQVIVGGTGGNTCTYIYGEADRIKNQPAPTGEEQEEKLCKIIVVYTLNYSTPGDPYSEYVEFKKAIGVLWIAANAKGIEVEVKQFRPVVAGVSKLVLADDYQDPSGVNESDSNWLAQSDKIDKLHDKIKDSEIIDSETFKVLLMNENINLVVDGIVGSGIRPYDDNICLLTAIPRAQIRIMATGILWLKERVNVYVLSIDNPSGMNEFGVWTISLAYIYPVHGVLSSVWNKKLANSTNFVGTAPEFLVLDIIYNSKRLFDVLYNIIDTFINLAVKAGNTPDPNHVDLLMDIANAKAKPGSAIQFKQGVARMEVA